MAAAKDKTDWLVQYHVATGLTRIVTTTDDLDPAVMATARVRSRIAQAARPDLANGHALAARLDTADDTDATRALQTIRRARTVSPGREDYILIEAFVLMRLGDYVAARQRLTPLTAPRHSARYPRERRRGPRTGDAARARGGRLRGAARGPETRDRAPRRPRREAPVYRRLEPGEHRVEGLLERIDCTAKEVVLEVNVAGTTERFVAESLNAVAFISHRDDLRGMIACSPRTPPDRVYVTWRPADSAVKPRQVIAVEFLPLPR